jgi:hypothetical protein
VDESLPSRRGFLTQSLADLKTLNLSCVTESAIVASHSLPFHLATPTLSFDNTPSSSSLIDALSRQSSITSLVLFTSGFVPAELLTRLAPLAPGLDTLDISLGDVPGAADDFFKGCTQLKHLKTRNLLSNAAKHVAASLESWTVQGIFSNQLSTLLEILDAGPVATTQLERLVLQYCYARASPRWVELVQKCREKKIKLIVGDTVGYE